MTPSVERQSHSNKTDLPETAAPARAESGEARPSLPEHFDPAALAAELRQCQQGEVRFDEGSRALYATTGSNYRQVPIGVVIPKSVADVAQIVAACRKFQAPLLSRGGGTSLAGQCENVAVVMDMSKYLNRVLELDPVAKLARVEPGTILDDLRGQAEKFHLTFAPDPSTHNHCTLGGMIGNNSCGVHSQMAGRTSDNVHELDILTYDGLRMRVGRKSELELERIIREGGRKGEIYGRLKKLSARYAELIRARYPKIPRRISGYNLDALLPENGFHVARALVGTEGTCVTILEATVNLVHSPPCRSLVILGYPSIFEAGDHVTEIDAFKPVGLEGMDEILVHDLSEVHPETRSYLPEGKGWLLVEFGGDTKQESDAKALAMMARLKLSRNAPSMKLFTDLKEEKKVWKTREGGLGATARPKGEKDTWEGWEDSAVPPENLGVYLRKLQKLYEKYNYHGSLYGHFGQACVHTRIDFDFHTAEGTKKFRSFLDEATSLVVSLGGSLSGEHGDGQSRAEFLPKMFGPELMGAFREFKSIWDPAGKMNPHKLIDPYRVDENLKYGVEYNPPPVETHFKFPRDRGNMPYATLRCVGIGECRRMEGGTMCPSFRVTREEKHSTRGRAHLLHEMLRGDSPVHQGWKSEAVKESLDLCLACKGCKSDCPMGVDMATYKAEFLSHYYKGRVRPLTAYSMGLIDVWARMGSLFPWLVNFLTHAPVFRVIAKRLAGIAPERQVPTFAPRTFKSWWKKRGPRPAGGKPVILWADTFNNHFHPETAIAAVEVLEAAGCQVYVPPQNLCCGRPLYDFGMLDRAKAYLENTLETLRPMIREGIPMVGLEPSCTAVFRDEMRNLLPNDLDALRLASQTYLLSEYLEKFAGNAQLPQLTQKKALVQGHCHHKSIMKMDAESKVLKRLGLDTEVLDEGCCGMAGSFGFEAGEHYEVSMKVGEQKILPAVRKAAPSTLIVANGFSCREQILQGTGRRALHLSEVIQLAMHERASPNSTERSEPKMELFNIVETYAQEIERAGERLPAPSESISAATVTALAAPLVRAPWWRKSLLAAGFTLLTGWLARHLLGRRTIAATAKLSQEKAA